MVEAIDYHNEKAACLVFFTNKSLETINGESTTIQWEKAPGSDKDSKMRVWELKHICEILKIKPDDDYEDLRGYADFT
ncbi:hypothetical protein V5O48_009738 [Marasmius crinis-equi]|uniref:Uncharacterized protein n=1 Tax=Marasmius crinis-equi TaxID=585013 RepID=A0ABR3FA92_9AGAR